MKRNVLLIFCMLCCYLSYGSNASGKFASLHSPPLNVNDPITDVTWATYFGGGQSDVVRGVTTDPEGNVYVTGTTSSIGLATPGAFQTAMAGETDIFIAKFSPDGERLWATYFGGLDSETASTIEYHNGQLLIGGDSSSDGLSTPGAFKEERQGGQTEALVASFDANTGQRNWATYYGASAGSISDIAVDANGYIYAAGVSPVNLYPMVSCTGSSDFATPGTYIDENGNCNAIFLVKLSNDGSAREWGTYPIRGAIAKKIAKTGGLHIEVDASGDVYVGGATTSLDEVVDAGFAANVGEGTNTDIGFLGKFSGTDGTRTWGRFYSGVIVDFLLDEANNQLLTVGSTANGTEGFLSSFSLAGIEQYRSVIGGINGETYVSGITFSADKSSIIVNGNTSTSSGEFAFSCPFQPQPEGGGWDIFLNSFDPGTGQPLWGTYYGGADQDYFGGSRALGSGAGFGPFSIGNTRAISTANGDMILAMNTLSAGLGTEGAYQESSGGSTDGLLVRFNNGFLPDNIVVSPSLLSPLVQQTCILGVPEMITGNAVGIVSPANLDRRVFYQWQQSDSPTGPWQNIAGEIFKDLQPEALQGNRYYRRQVQLKRPGCNNEFEVMDTSETVSVIVNQNYSPLADADGPLWYVCESPTNMVTLNGGASGGSGAYAYQWFEGSPSMGTLLGTNSSLTTNPVTSATTYTLRVTDEAGCTDDDQVTIIPAVANAGESQAYCQGAGGVQIGTAPIADPAVAYQWTVVSGSANSLSCTSCAQPVASPAQETVYRLTVTVTQKNGQPCSTTDEVTVIPVTAPGSLLDFAGADQTVCKNESVVLGMIEDNTYQYTWTPGQYLSDVHSARPVFSAGTAAVTNGYINYAITAVKDGCTFVDDVQVSVINSRITDQDETQCGPLWVYHLDEANAPQAVYSWSVISGDGEVLTTSNNASNAYLKSNAGITHFRRTVTLNGISCHADVYVTPCEDGGSSCDFDIITLSEQECPKVFGGVVLRLGTTVSNLNDYHFSWSPANLVDNPTASAVTITSTSEATITVTITNKYDPSITCSESININPPGWSLPGFNMEGAICRNTPTVIGETPVAGFSYQWLPATGLDRDDVGNPTATLSASVAYQVKKTELASGCTNSLTLPVYVSSPVANAGNDRAVCNGATITLGTPAPEGTSWTYAWEPSNAAWENGSTAADAQPQVFFALAGSQTYTVTVTDPVTGCMSTDQVVLSGTITPGEYTGPAQTICEGQEVTLGRQAEPGAHYEWFAGGLMVGTGSTITVSPATTTNYTLRVSYEGCTIPAEDNVTVTVHARPTNLSLVDRNLCKGASVGIGYGSVRNPGVPSDVASFAWSPATGLSAVNIANPIATVYGSVEYTVLITMNTGCVYEEKVLVNPIIDAGSDAIICQGESTVIGLPARPGFTYSWTGSGIVSGGMTAQPTVRPTVTTTYTLTVSDDSGPVCTDDVVVTVNQPEPFQITGNTTICQGGNTTLSLVGTPGAGTLWQWSPVEGVTSPNATSTTVAPATTGTHTYRLTQTNLQTGCSNYREIIVVTRENNMEVTSGSVSLCPETAEPVTMPVSVTPAGDYQYTWSPATGLSNAFIANPTVVTTQSRVYTVTITDNVTKCQVVSTVPVTARSAEECALPVTLVFFEAKPIEGHVYLSWATTEETRSERFDVERSVDGKRWNTISTVKSHGESSDYRFYESIDEHPFQGQNLYRLKIVDTDGSYTYSRMAAVMKGSGEQLLVTEVYPNPVSDYLHINTTDWSHVELVEVFDLLGRVLLKTNASQEPRVDISHFSSGVYILRITTDAGLSNTVRFIVQK